MIFQFNTVVAVKPVDRDKWWIDSDLVKVQEIEGENINDALNKFIEVVKDNPYYLEVSKTALKRKKKMFIDTENGAKQVGFVITAKTSFQTNDYEWVDKYIDLWIDIQAVEYHPVF